MEPKEAAFALFVHTTSHLRRTFSVSFDDGETIVDSFICAQHQTLTLLMLHWVPLRNLLAELAVFKGTEIRATFCV
jgi:hypothetical protein